MYDSTGSQQLAYTLLYVHLSVCLCTCVSVCLSVCLSVCVFHDISLYLQRKVEISTLVNKFLKIYFPWFM